MQLKEENKKITLKEFRSVSAHLLQAVSENERPFYRNSLETILKALNISLLDKSGKKLKFNDLAWRLLDNVFKDLGEHREKICPAFTKMHAVAGESMQPLKNKSSSRSESKPLPEEIWMHVCHFSSMTGISKLRRTNSFFNEKLQPLHLEMLLKEHPVKGLFRGKSFDLLKASHFGGLDVLMKWMNNAVSVVKMFHRAPEIQQAAVNALSITNILRLEQISDDLGNLKGIGFYSKNALTDMNSMFSLGMISTEKDGMYYGVINQHKLRSLHYAIPNPESDLTPPLKIFDDALIDQLQDNDLDILSKFWHLQKSCFYQREHFSSYCRYSPDARPGNRKTLSFQFTIKSPPTVMEEIRFLRELGKRFTKDKFYEVVVSKSSDEIFIRCDLDGLKKGFDTDALTLENSGFGRKI